METFWEIVYSLVVNIHQKKTRNTSSTRQHFYVEQITQKNGNAAFFICVEFIRIIKFYHMLV